jgi:nitroreductase
MVKVNLTAEQLLTTTRAVRKRLDFYRPVEMEVLRECVEIATQAPSGSNIQPWRMIFITDAQKRQRIADLYRDAFKLYRNAAVPGIWQAFEERGHGQQIQRISESAEYLVEHLHEVPVFVIPCLISGSNPLTPPRLENAANYLAAPMWASVLPAVWSFMQAARLHGLGTSLTTLHLLHEKEISELLGIPYESVTQVALIPLAYTIGTEFRLAARKPVEEVFRINSW